MKKNRVTCALVIFFSDLGALLTRRKHLLIGFLHPAVKFPMYIMWAKFSISLTEGKVK